ncbi:hypothetical protein [Nonomuraea roseola]|uniref:Uncharacterized protein n=1 Tax=Nonomuraea roseola TaxID=46179 RepID=A0ABV5Q897_9ACTN
MLEPVSADRRLLESLEFVRANATRASELIGDEYTAEEDVIDERRDLHGHGAQARGRVLRAQLVRSSGPIASSWLATGPSFSQTALITSGEGRSSPNPGEVDQVELVSERVAEEPTGRIRGGQADGQALRARSFSSASWTRSAASCGLPANTWP